MTAQHTGLRLCAVDERAVLLGSDGAGEREVDPDNLALDRGLAEALHEWARVASAVTRAPSGGPVAGAVVSRRGLQLAGRVAAAMGVPVSYVDPLTGDVSVVDPPAGQPEPEHRAWPPEPGEPTPWLTGLTVSAFVFVLVLCAVLSLAVTLAVTNPLLAVGSNVVVTAGLLPSVWLVRQTPVWRWIGLGVAAAIGAAWLAIPFILL